MQHDSFSFPSVSFFTPPPPPAALPEPGGPSTPSQHHIDAADKRRVASVIRGSAHRFTASA